MTIEQMLKWLNGKNINYFLITTKSNTAQANRFRVLDSWLALSNKQAGELFTILKKIPGWRAIQDIDTPKKSNNWYPVHVNSVENGDVLTFCPSENVYEALFVPGNVDIDLLYGRQGSTP